MQGVLCYIIRGSRFSYRAGDDDVRERCNHQRLSLEKFEKRDFYSRELFNKTNRDNTVIGSNYSYEIAYARDINESRYLQYYTRRRVL